jgi:hypothetical protein
MLVATLPRHYALTPERYDQQINEMVTSQGYGALFSIWTEQVCPVCYTPMMQMVAWGAADYRRVFMRCGHPEGCGHRIEFYRDAVNEFFGPIWRRDLSNLSYPIGHPDSVLLLAAGLDSTFWMDSPVRIPYYFYQACREMVQARRTSYWFFVDDRVQGYPTLFYQDLVDYNRPYYVQRFVSWGDLTRFLLNETHRWGTQLLF